MEKPMEKLMTVRTQSTAETEACGAELAKQMLDDAGIPPFIALYGDLGVGKTAFVRGFASVNEYRAKPRPLFHFDMYRISNEDDLLSIGFYDYLDRPGICLVEWSENIPYALPDDYVRVALCKDDADKPDSRTLTIEQIGGAGA